MKALLGRAPLGVWLLGLALLLLLFGAELAQDPMHSDLSFGIGERGGPRGPSAEHWLGTDRLFRDQLARLLVGARHSLTLGLGAGLLAVTLGALIGVAAGMSAHRRYANEIAVFALDVVQSFPFLLLVLAVTSVFDRVTTLALIVVLGSTSWLSVARLVRSKTMQLVDLDFVQAARALGRGPFGVAAAYILPNLGNLLAASLALIVSQCIIAESVLGYLGLGLSPELPNWGQMIAEAQDVLLGAPWLFVAPAVALGGTALSLQVLSTWLEKERSA